VGIRCPNHGYRFDLKTGECNVDPAFNANTYPIRIKDGNILLDLEGTTGIS
jgi:nitrite reductase (NADH) small subunit